MSDNFKIQDTHLQRCAYVYIRQSSATQVLVNRESTDRQYQLNQRAVQLGWSKTQIQIIDEDLAHTGSGVVIREMSRGASFSPKRRYFVRSCSVGALPLIEIGVHCSA